MLESTTDLLPHMDTTDRLQLYMAFSTQETQASHPQQQAVHLARSLLAAQQRPTVVSMDSALMVDWKVMPTCLARPCLQEDSSRAPASTHTPPQLLQRSVEMLPQLTRLVA